MSSRKLHIGIAGPISTESVARFLKGGVAGLPAGYGGAPFLGTLIEALLDRGHQVSAYTTSPGLPLDHPEPVVVNGDSFKIYYCPVRKHSIRMDGWHLGRTIDFFALERRYLAQAIRIDNPDIVHAHWAYEFALAAIASGTPHVVTCHDAPHMILKYMPNLYRLGRYFMARKAMRLAKKITTVSPYMRDLLEPLTYKDNEIIPNPIPSVIAHRQLDRLRELSPANAVVVMVANGWGHLKNSRSGIIAFAKIRAKLGGARLRLFGVDFGPGEAAHCWSKAHGIAEGIEFVGRLPYERLLEEIAKADALIHPSLEESFGMVVAEAMALGVPVVGGKASGAVPWIVGDVGVLVDVTDPDEIAGAIISILSDPTRWQELREASHHNSRLRFLPQVVAAAYESVYIKQLTEMGPCN